MFCGFFQNNNQYLYELSAQLTAAESSLGNLQALPAYYEGELEHKQLEISETESTISKLSQEKIQAEGNLSDARSTCF